MKAKNERRLAATILTVVMLLPLGCKAFQSSSYNEAMTINRGGSRAVSSSSSSRRYLVPNPDMMLVTESSPLWIAKDMEDFYKSLGIFLALGGGLIPATIAANKAMFTTMSGQKEKGEDIDQLYDVNAGETIDPTTKDVGLRQYVESSGCTGPELAFSNLLFATDPIYVADIVAVLGRIQDVNSIADWKNLPSTKLPKVSQTNPPMWLPRRAFKVNIRKSKWLGWPTDPQTGLPVGGAKLKTAEESRISKSGAIISDAALDAVFDTWAWGASIATPDKVDTTLKLYKPSPTEVSLDNFIGAALRGRSVTGISALTFVVIQVVVYTTVFIFPTIKFFFDIDILSGLGF